MGGHSIEEMRKHVRIYIAVFIALAVLTLVTVWAASLQVSPSMHIIVALFIAAIKGTLVAAYFMHLISEKKTITSILVITAFLFLFMLLMTFFAETTRGPIGQSYFNVQPQLPQVEGGAHH
ncbi:MAG: cytochrome C oxidase subunit IV family protein [Deltaproteobacteria bacterium]|nr:cytochrome C oxidase subunit IV family protein [Deltaproteobacteria bacterium]